MTLWFPKYTWLKKTKWPNIYGKEVKKCQLWLCMMSLVSTYIPVKYKLYLTGAILKHVCLSMAMLCLLMLTFWLLCLRMPPCKGQICVFVIQANAEHAFTEVRINKQKRGDSAGEERFKVTVLWSTLSFTSDISPVFWAGLISLSQPVYVCVYVCVYSVFVQALIRCTVFWTAGWKLPGSQNSGHDWNASAALLLFCLCLHLLFSYRLHTHTPDGRFILIVIAFIFFFLLFITMNLK